MKTKKRYLPIAGIVILFVILGYFLVKSPGGKGINKTTISELPPDAGLTGKTLHIVEDHPEEGYRFVLDADQAASSQNEERITLNGVGLRFERKNGLTMEIKGAHGDFNKSLNEISLKGDVQGSSSEGYSISTEDIVFNQKEGVLKTDEPVKMLGPFFSVSGRGLRFYPGKETLRIISNATTMLELKESL
jgi:LPS export ABC transporter protein LptC